MDSTWSLIHGALSQDHQLVEQLCDKAEFWANVSQNREGEFINLLKHMADENSWKDLLCHGILFILVYHTHPAHQRV